MGTDDGTLDLDQARRTYDKIGRFQDWNRFYERAATEDLLLHGDLGNAHSVYEFGCGTGSLAERLLDSYLPPDAEYRAIDISDTMVRLASKRLSRFGSRVTVDRVSGDLPLPGDVAGFDRFVTTYVFDLLASSYTRVVIDEAARLLAPGGLLCAAGLSHGRTPIGRMVSRGWSSVWRRAPRLVGGCRPLDLVTALGDGWTVVYHGRVRAWGVPSEVVIVTPVS